MKFKQNMYAQFSLDFFLFIVKKNCLNHSLMTMERGILFLSYHIHGVKMRLKKIRNKKGKMMFVLLAKTVRYAIDNNNI